MVMLIKLYMQILLHITKKHQIYISAEFSQFFRKIFVPRQTSGEWEPSLFEVGLKKVFIRTNTLEM